MVRVPQVKLSMARLKTVLGERQREHKAVLAAQEAADGGEAEEVRGVACCGVQALWLRLTWSLALSLPWPVRRAVRPDAVLRTRHPQRGVQEGHPWAQACVAGHDQARVVPPQPGRTDAARDA